MRKCSRRFSRLFFAMVVAHMPFYAISHMTVSHAAEISQAGASKESAYQEIERDGRLYVFASSERKAEFEKSGELGKGIIKIGYGPNGETVVFDSEEAVIEYASRLVKDIPERRISGPIMRLKPMAGCMSLPLLRGKRILKSQGNRE